ncbi:hypothetical protein ACFQ3C_13010 [Seohaeicola saemankumensis]|uniref:Uncharacterized protein n=1 Tax=Seohaeicola saemankumensis TaxID=481181 RepID=A0ABW3TGH6_9RHOB
MSIQIGSLQKFVKMTGLRADRAIFPYYAPSVSARQTGLGECDRSLNLALQQQDELIF